MFFNTTFDVVFSLVLIVCAVLLLTGRGKVILTGFRGRKNKQKPLAYEEKKLSITMGLLCLVMFVAELIMIFFSETSVLAVLLSMVLVLVSFIVAIVYLRKCAKVEVVEEEPKPEKTIRERINELERKSR